MISTGDTAFDLICTDPVASLSPSSCSHSPHPRARRPLSPLTLLFAFSDRALRRGFGPPRTPLRSTPHTALRGAHNGLKG